MYYVNSETKPVHVLNHAIRIQQRIPELEPIVLKSASYSVLYAKYVIKGRWPEAEPFIIETGSIVLIMEYINDVIKGRWPEAEETLLLRSAELNQCISEIEFYLCKYPEAHASQQHNKNTPVMIDDVVIIDLPNSITDSQLENFFELLLQTKEDIEMYRHSYLDYKDSIKHLAKRLKVYRSRNSRLIEIRKHNVDQYTVDNLKTMDFCRLMNVFHVPCWEKGDFY